jgi:hypothetical protein
MVYNSSNASRVSKTDVPRDMWVSSSTGSVLRQKSEPQGLRQSPLGPVEREEGQVNHYG